MAPVSPSFFVSSEAASAAVKELHSYETPAIMVLPVESVEPDYHKWIVEETTAKS